MKNVRISRVILSQIMSSIHSLFFNKEHTTFLNPLKVKVAFFLSEIFGCDEHKNSDEYKNETK